MNTKIFKKENVLAAASFIIGHQKVKDTMKKFEQQGCSK
jgi:hypothetical protein